MVTRNQYRFRTLNQCNNHPLTVCLAIIGQQQALRQRVCGVLPALLAQHVQHCVQSGKRLLIYTDSANWASQIRFFNGVILNAIDHTGQQNIERIQIKVIEQPAAIAPSRAPTLPSQAVIDYLQQHADSNSNDAVQQSLKRLANTLHKRMKRQQPAVLSNSDAAK